MKHEWILTLTTQIESERLDLLHAIIRIARRKAHIPIPTNIIDAKKADYRELHATHFGGLFWASGQRPPILDLGCGTGIWAVEMAKYAFVRFLWDMANHRSCEKKVS